MDSILEFHCSGPCHNKVYPAIMGENGAGSSGGASSGRAAVVLLIKHHVKWHSNTAPRPAWKGNPEIHVL